MANKAQVRKTLETVAMFFAEKGEVLSQPDYIKCADKPVLLSGIRRVFRSYSRMLVMLERNEPELWLLATNPKPKMKMEMPKPQPVKIEVPKPVKTEVKKDGKDI